MSEFTPENDVLRAESTPAADIDETFAIVDELDDATDDITDDTDDEAFDDAADDEHVADLDDDEADDDTAPAESEAPAFTELGLPEELVKKLAENGVHSTFPIQAATIPDALAGRHVLGKARTGSGKTLAFGLAALANLKGKRARKGKPLALVLVPTRELAMQVTDALQPYGFAVGADIAAVYGGAPMYKQVFALRRGVELLVATPGRLTDLIEQGECDLSEVEIAILDEADQMADMGFMPIVTELLSQTDPAGQRLLFSATLDGAVDELVRQYLTDPVLHSVTPDDEDSSQMDHHLLIVEPADKALVTAEIAARHTPGEDDGRRTILFARTKLGADRIAEKIREAGVSALALHGGMTQRARTKTLADFKDGRVPVLVATDVAARGIHVDGIDLVLHVDPAGDPKDYLHRAGRTARAGESGTVVTLVLPKQRKATQRLLQSAGVDAELTKVAPSSETLRELTGGRPVAEYIAEADAYHAARRAARESRMTDDRREGRGGREGLRAGREGFGGRDNRDGSRPDRFDRNHRGGRFEERDNRAGSRERTSFNSGERRPFADRERTGFGDRDNRGQGRGFDRSSSGRGFDRDNRSSFGDRGAGRSFDRNGSQGGGFDRDRTDRGESRSFDRNSSERGFDRNGSGRGFDRDNRGSYGNRDNNRDNRSGERRNFTDRDNRGGSENRGGGFNGGERRSFDRNSSQGRSDNRGSYGNREGRTFDRNTSGRSDNRGSYGNRDNRGGSEGRSGGFNGGERRSFDRDNRTTGGTSSYGQRRGFDRDNRSTGGTNDRPQNRTFGDRRSNDRNDDRYSQRPGFDGPRRHTDRDNRTNTDRPAERRDFNERTAFGRPRGGYSNDQRDNRPPRDRRW
ncbi:DEAD/DEAH box helicase [Catenulispora sp. NL8]|uniref:DEAD/DEAH box helicase n=1 Tax=Catenulispora pinistramenti TaxID=2705254 RepID=A0ABS5KUN2_9ACTN|nr:DEAD/DEAH box helicase [Catenulispora pinistramenti]MBS2549753.1 DEAD/DEAH box helicase [Catenulispora pinistramenti]